MAGKRYLIFTTRVREHYDDMSVSERKVADHILKDPSGILRSSTREIAEAAGVSTATVVRFCRSCGFSGMAELKLILRKEYLALDGGNEKIMYSDVSPDDPIAIVRQKILGYHNMIISDMLQGWNEEAYVHAVDEIASANRILICGEGGSRATALILFHILNNMGIECETYMDSVFEIVKADKLREGDVIIGVTYTGRLRNTIESFEVAKKHGTTTIALVGYTDSPIIKYTDLVLNTTKLTKGFYDSALSIRVSELAAIELLLTLLALKQNRTMEATSSPDHVVSIRRVWD